MSRPSRLATNACFASRLRLIPRKLERRHAPLGRRGGGAGEAGAAALPIGIVNGMYHGMKTTIDSAGRVVIPRAARVAAQLEPGTELEVLVENGVIQLEPVVKSARLVRRGRLLVAASEEPVPPLRQAQVDQTLEEVRGGSVKRRR